MDSYLIDRETLGRFVDELIKKKPLPVNNLEELEALREDTIKQLDDKIGMNIFSHFTEEQNAEFNQLLDAGAGEEDYDEFFAKHHIDIEALVSDAMKTFAADFLKGAQNA